ncbi:hypothetical protein F4X10_06440 [Candidatus Poribacteria bacterium]|nr:hypothetical protein [Candidatus Poribacteria bacterium]
MKFCPVFREIVYMGKYFLIFLMLLGIFGCGSDEATSEPIDEDPIEKLVGTWDLINHEMNIEDAEEVRGRLVISSDSTLLWKMWFTFSERLESSPLIYMKLEMNATIKGQCVVSDSSLAFIYHSEDALNLEFHFSFEVPGNPELQQRLEQELEKHEQEFEELEAEAEENFVSGIKVESYTGTLNLEGNILTLMGEGAEYVFEKK